MPALPELELRVEELLMLAVPHLLPGTSPELSEHLQRRPPRLIADPARAMTMLGLAARPLGPGNDRRRRRTSAPAHPPAALDVADAACALAPSLILTRINC